MYLLFVVYWNSPEQRFAHRYDDDGRRVNLTSNEYATNEHF